MSRKLIIILDRNNKSKETIKIVITIRINWGKHHLRSIGALSAVGLLLLKIKKIWTKASDSGWGVLKFVKDNSVRHIDIETPCCGSCKGIIFWPFYSFIHGANPVKSISLACLGLNEALVELKWFGQLRPTCVVLQLFPV